MPTCALFGAPSSVTLIIEVWSQSSFSRRHHCSLYLLLFLRQLTYPLAPRATHSARPLALAVLILQEKLHCCLLFLLLLAVSSVSLSSCLPSRLLLLMFLQLACGLLLQNHRRDTNVSTSSFQLLLTFSPTSGPEPPAS